MNNAFKNWHFSMISYGKVFLLLSMLVLVLYGCGSTTPTSTQAGEVTATPKPRDAQEVLNSALTKMQKLQTMHLIDKQAADGSITVGTNKTSFKQDRNIVGDIQQPDQSYVTLTSTVSTGVSSQKINIKELQRDKKNYFQTANGSWYTISNENDFVSILDLSAAHMQTTTDASKKVQDKGYDMVYGGGKRLRHLSIPLDNAAIATLVSSKSFSGNGTLDLWIDEDSAYLYHKAFQATGTATDTAGTITGTFSETVDYSNFNTPVTIPSVPTTSSTVQTIYQK